MKVFTPATVYFRRPIRLGALKTAIELAVLGALTLVAVTRVLAVADEKRPAPLLFNLALFAAAGLLCLVLNRWMRQDWVEYVDRNVRGYEVWAFKHLGVDEIHWRISARGMSVFDIVAMHFKGCCHEGYLIRYPLGGWFAHEGLFVRVSDGRPEPLSFDVSRQGGIADEPGLQKVGISDLKGNRCAAAAGLILARSEELGPDALSAATGIGALVERLAA